MAAKKNGLGKGLDSLISDKVKTTPGKSSTAEVTDEKAEKINFLNDFHLAIIMLLLIKFKLSIVKIFT